MRKNFSILLSFIIGLVILFTASALYKHKAEAVTATPSSGNYQTGSGIAIELKAKLPNPDVNAVSIRLQASGLTITNYTQPAGSDWIIINDCEGDKQFNSFEVCVSLAKSTPIIEGESLGEIEIIINDDKNARLTKLQDNAYSDGSQLYPDEGELALFNNSSTTVQPVQVEETDNSHTYLIIGGAIGLIIFLIFITIIILKSNRQSGLKGKFTAILSLIILTGLIGAGVYLLITLDEDKSVKSSSASDNGCAKNGYGCGVIGWADTNAARNSCILDLWALDTYNMEWGVTVDIYVNNNLVKQMTPNHNRPDLPDAVGAIGLNHGYVFDLKSVIKAGQTASIKVFGNHIPNSPYASQYIPFTSGYGINDGLEISVTCQNVPTIGYLDTITADGYAQGWAYDPNTSNDQIKIHFYIDNTAGQAGTFIGEVSTDVFRSDVNTSIGLTGNHGFNFRIPDQYRDGKQHTLYAYGLDSNGTANNNSMLTYSGKTFQLQTNTPTPTATPSSSPSSTTVVCGALDTNGDNKVTLLDLAAFVNVYGKNCSDSTASVNNCGKKDSNNDGKIDILDLANLATKIMSQQTCN